jgi:hypothetical protein
MRYSYNFNSDVWITVYLKRGVPISDIPAIYEEICQARPRVRSIRDVSFQWSDQASQDVPRCWYCGEVSGLVHWETATISYRDGRPIGEPKAHLMCKRCSTRVRASLALRACGRHELADELDNENGIETRYWITYWREVQ